MLSDLLIMIYAGMVSWLLSWLAWPWLLKAKLPLPDAGWGFGRISSWLMIAVPVWFLAHLGLPINTQAGIWLIILIWAIITLLHNQPNWAEIKQQVKSVRSYIIAEEALFYFGWFFLNIVRGFQPDINGLEKFMDHGIMESYLRSPKLPIEDMWLSGFDFNYYTFGHFFGSVMTRIWGVLPEVSYNLLLALVMGMLMVGGFQLVTFLIKSTVKAKKQLVIAAGVLTSFLLVFAGNTQAIWYFFTHGSWQGYWYPDATRFIPNTIHEFPAYSFIVSDLHGHVWNLLLVFPLVTIILLWFQQLWSVRQKFDFSLNWQHLGKLALVIGFGLGLMASTSTWGTMVYGLLMAILAGLFLIFQKKLKLPGLYFSAVVAFFAMILAASPWFLHFTSISEGVRLVTERSSIHDLLVLWSGHVGVTILAVLSALTLLKQKLTKTQLASLGFVLGLAILAIVLLILPEIIFFKDIYPSHPRANTMFKFTFEAFMIMLVLCGWLVAAAQTLQVRWQKIAVNVGLAMFIVAVFCYPYFGYRDYYGLKQYKSLNGLEWLMVQNPNDYQAIKWLKQNTYGRPVVLEAVGESYTTFARVSTFTGLPTVLGWRVHEWLWRGSFDLAGARTPEVETIYTRPLSAEARQLIAKYKVKYIFVGDKEREAYQQINEAQLKQLGLVVFNSGQTFIVQLP